MHCRRKRNYPHVPLISYSLEIKDDKTKWTLVFSNVTEDDIRELNLRAFVDDCSPAMRKEWDKLAESNQDRLEVKYVVDKAANNWKGECGAFVRSTC